MADDTTFVDAPPHCVYAVLADPGRYGLFVVGTSQIRRFHPRWPRPGTRFHHLLGVKPIVLAGSTASLATDYLTYLVLDTGLGIFGATLTTFYLVATPEGTRLEVREEPWRGAVTCLWSKAVDPALELRNRLLLKRLSELAERQFQLERSVLPAEGSSHRGDATGQRPHPKSTT